jgi:hypothetical protein
LRGGKRGERGRSEWGKERRKIEEEVRKKGERKRVRSGRGRERRKK